MELGDFVYELKDGRLVKMIQCDSLVKIYEMEQHKVMALEGLDLR